MDDSTAIGMAGTIGVFSFLIVVTVATAWTVRQVAKLRAETLRLAIEKGQALPQEAPGERVAKDQRRGILAIALGLGLSFALAVTAGLEAAAFGAVPTLLGVGWLIIARLGRATSNEPRLPPPSALAGEDLDGSVRTVA